MSTTTPRPPSSGLSEAQKRFLAPFIKCTKDVFSRMLRWDVDLVGFATNDSTASRHDCSGIVGVSGSIRGSVVVSISSEMAIAAAESFLGERPDSITAEVIDTVGELTNMIGGSSKDKMGIDGIALGLPTVVVGKDHSISFDQGAHVEMLRFQSPHGPFTVEIAIVGLGNLL
ncbi:MAG: chemotaxis protein CheX [Pirellula sp.]|nr:chemotaxis protein CheX [Pirellula sp.]